MNTEQVSQSLPFWMTYPTRDGFTAYCEKEAAERMCKSKECAQVNGAYFVGAITEKKTGRTK